MRRARGGARLAAMKIATPKRRVTLDAAIDRFVIHGTLTAPSGDRPDFHGWLELNTALEGMLDTGADDARNDSPTLCMDVSYQTSDVSAELCGGAAEMTGVESDRSVVPIALERGCARGVEREHVRSIGRALPVPTAHASTEAGPAAGRAVGASPALAGTQARAAPCRTGGEHRIRAPHAPARASGFDYGDAAIGAGVAGGVALLETIGSPSRANAKSAHAYRAAGRRSSALAASRQGSLLRLAATKQQPHIDRG
jgi:hypothetical protein